MITLKLHPDWWKIVCFAWSFRLIVLAEILSVLAAALLFIVGNVKVTLLLIVLTMIVNVAAGVSRVIAQKAVAV